jgi:hypothetical protein
MRRSPSRGLLILTALTLACGSATEPRTDLLEARAFPSRLLLENLTDEPVYYFVRARDPNLEIDFSLCTDRPATCSSVPVGGSVSIPYSRIAHYDFGDTEAVVSHWRLVPDVAPGTFRATDMRGLTVRLY